MFQTNQRNCGEKELSQRVCVHRNDSLPHGAWIVVLGAWCMGTFQNYYEDALLKQYSASTIAWIPSLQVFFMMALGPLIGALHDMFGHQVLLATGTILHTFGLFMASVSNKWYQIFLAQGVCSAIGAAAVFLPAVTIIQEWFAEKQDLALGIVTTGSSLGGVVFPIMVSRLIKEVGFGWAMRSSAFIILALLVVANITITSNIPRKQRKWNWNRIPSIFRDARFVVLMLGLFIYAFGFFVPLNYVAAEATAAGVKPDQVQYLIPMLNAASLFGRLLSGLLAAKIGRYNVFIVACYATGILVLTLWKLAVTTWERRCFAILFGFFSGTFIALIPGLVYGLSRAVSQATEHCCSVDEGNEEYVTMGGMLEGGGNGIKQTTREEATKTGITGSKASDESINPHDDDATANDTDNDNGFRVGAIFCSASFGGLLANPICGKILGGENDWDGLKTFAGVFCIVGTTFVLFIRYRLAGWKLASTV